ncbi:phosphotransferase [Neobacillus cucumis]|uniref:phosphotransferase n=1 Tax=Neobacillus cucumis TaxID=1740721 RepID=UPI001EF77E06|nr:phosphotransferase [Neobacillus cucumis]MBM7652296.1 putative Ser/Thr protein kinase [Neobacillus cucumis]
MREFEMLAAKNKGILSPQIMQDYQQVGKGADGSVYRLSDEWCVKIYPKEETFRKELDALIWGQKSPVVPRLYGHGSNYVVIEYINGITLKKYLKDNNHFSTEIVEKVLYLLDELKKVGFTRHDAEVRHILFNEKGDIKVIDLKRYLMTDRTVPTKLLTGLDKLGYKKEFLEKVKNLQPSRYKEWEPFID